MRDPAWQTSSFNKGADRCVQWAFVDDHVLMRNGDTRKERS